MILDSANSVEIKSLPEGCVRCSEEEKKHSDRDEGAQALQWTSRRPVCRRIYMRQCASSPRKEWIRDAREETRESKRRE